MGTQVYRETYLAALEVAHSDLDQIIEQFEMLQLRKQQLEHVLGAIDNFLGSREEATYELRQSEPIQLEPAQAEAVQQMTQPALRAMPSPEPVTAAAFSPMPEPILDPIQSRINRALGLAVA
jgi:hypothetical protein